MGKRLLLVSLTTLLLSSFLLVSCTNPAEQGSQPRPKPPVSMVLEADLSKVLPEEKDSTVDSAIRIIKTRLNAYGVDKPCVKRQGSERILVELPKVENLDEVVTLITSRGQLNFCEQVNDQWVVAEAAGSNGQNKPLTGKYVRKAALVTSSDTDEVQVTFELNDEGAKLFEQITTRLIGKRLGIFLDDELISAPTIYCVITSKGTIRELPPDEARRLVVQLTSSALPVPVSVVSLKIEE